MSEPIFVDKVKLFCYIDTMKRFTEEHEWIMMITEDTALVGVTEYAVESLGDVTLVDILSVGTKVKAGKSFGDVESVKAVSELYAPLDGEIVEINEKLLDSPELINDSPMKEGWMIKLKLDDASKFDELMTEEEYNKLTENL